MSQMAPIVGQEASIKVFLPLYSTLCTNMSFQVRKVINYHLF